VGFLLLGRCSTGSSRTHSTASGSTRFDRPSAQTTRQELHHNRHGRIAALSVSQSTEEMMCDFSLHLVQSRPAKVGDRLITTNFVNSATRGFCAPSEPNVAVCLLPGTELAFDKEVRISHPLGLLLPKSLLRRIAGKTARFRQVNMDRPTTHHDALEFGDGQIVFLTRLRPGQRATVLQMPSVAALTADEFHAAQSATNYYQAPYEVIAP
jgi:hypothetical protein